MNLWPGSWKSVVTALGLFVFGKAGSLLAAEKLELPEGFSLWQKAAHLRVGVGYKDNVTLSSFNPQGSAFEILSLDAMLYRLPWNDWQFSLMAVGSDARYFNHDTGIDAEQNAAVSSEFAWFMGRGWKSVSTLQYVFINQVMDVSATYGTTVRQQVFGHGIIFKEGVRRDVGRWWGELSLSGSRYCFREPLDDYWQASPRLTLGRYYGSGSEVSVSYQAAPLLYDTREETDLTGTPIPGTDLRYLTQTADLSWLHFWDTKRRWRSSTRLAFESNQDNGSGYYDYTQYRVVEQLRYRASSWEVSAQASLAYYDFPNQPVSLTDPTERHRTGLHLTLRGEKRLSKHWSVYAAYDYERSFSNLEVERYQANLGSGGVEFAF